MTPKQFRKFKKLCGNKIRTTATSTYGDYFCKLTMRKFRHDYCRMLKCPMLADLIQANIENFILTTGKEL